MKAFIKSQPFIEIAYFLSFLMLGVKYLMTNIKLIYLSTTFNIIWAIHKSNNFQIVIQQDMVLELPEGVHWKKFQMCHMHLRNSADSTVLLSTQSIAFKKNVVNKTA